MQNSYSSLTSSMEQAQTSTAEELRSAHIKTLELLRTYMDENQTLIDRVEALEAQIVPSDISLVQRYGPDYITQAPITTDSNERELNRKLLDENADLKVQLDQAIKNAKAALAQHQEMENLLKRKDMEAQTQLEALNEELKQEHRRDINELLDKHSQAEKNDYEEKRRLIVERNDLATRYEQQRAGAEQDRANWQRAQRQHSELEARYEACLAELEEARARVGALCAERVVIDDLKLQNGIHKRDIALLTKEKEEFEEKYKAKTEELERQRLLIKDYDLVRFKEAQEAVAVLTKENKALHFEITTLREEAVSLEEQLAQAVQSQTDAATTSDNLRSQNKALNSQLERTQRELRSITQQRDAMEIARDGMEKELKVIATREGGFKEYVEMKRELGRCKARNKELAAINARLMGHTVVRAGAAEDVLDTAGMTSLLEEHSRMRLSQMRPPSGGGNKATSTQPSPALNRTAPAYTAARPARLRPIATPISSDDSSLSHTRGASATAPLLQDPSPHTKPRRSKEERSGSQGGVRAKQEGTAVGSASGRRGALESSRRQKDSTGPAKARNKSGGATSNVRGKKKRKNSLKEREGSQADNPSLDDHAREERELRLPTILNQSESQHSQGWVSEGYPDSPAART